MERVVYQVLTESIDFSSLFPRLYQRGSVIDVPKLPFAVYAMVGTQRLGRAFPRIPRLELWLYQEPGDYETINNGLVIADTLMEAISDRSVAGQRIAQADPQGWSGYLEDDIYRANTRNAAYHLVGSPG